MKIKKIVALILCAAILLSIYPMSLLAETDAELLAKLIADGYPTKSSNGYPLNIATYREYDLVVYGEPFGRKDKKNQYEFLGYSKDGLEVTNDLWAVQDFGDLTKMNYYIFSGAAGSWTTQDVAPEQIDHLFRYKPIVDENEPVNLSVSDILAHKVNQEAAKRGITTESGKDGIRKEFVMLQVLPTLVSHGSVRVMYRTSSGNPMHNTFIVPRMALKYNFECGVKIDAGSTYTLQPGQKSIDIPVKLNGNISATGISTTQLITGVQLKFEGATKPGTAASPNAPFTKTVKAENLQVGENKLTLTGYAIYKSKFGDEMTREDTTTITIIKPAPTTPTAEINPVADPNYVKFEDKDIAVKLNVNSELFAYNDLANIKEVRLYARFKEDTAAQQIILTPRLKAQGTFDFTIPKSKVTGDSYEQYFVATVKYIFKTPVNNNTSADATKEVAAVVYKDNTPPPTGNELPPAVTVIADITAPAIVVMGDDVFISGAGSRVSDPNWEIVSYDWSFSLPYNLVSGFIQNGSGLSGKEGTIWFTQPGTCIVELTVTAKNKLTGAVMTQRKQIVLGGKK